MKKKIILIENDKDLSRIISDRLQSIPEFSITVCSSGKDGMNSLGETIPDFLLLDIELPDANGLDLLQAVRAKNNPVKSVILSSFASQENRIRAKKLNALRFFEKPFELDELILFLKQNS